MTKCSKKQRDRAVDLYIRYERCAADVIRELGYPGKGVLLSWCADRFEEECTGVPSGRSERYRRYGDGRKRVAVEHYLEYGGGSAAPCGCLAIRKVRLHFVREPHTVVRAIAQEPLEVRQILRCADDQDVTDPGHHQHAQRNMTHRHVQCLGIPTIQFRHLSRNWHTPGTGDRKSTRLNSSHPNPSRMPSSA